MLGRLSARSRPVAVSLSSAMLAALLSAVSFAAPAVALDGGEDVPSVPGQPHGEVPGQRIEKSMKPLPEPVWPQAGRAVVDLTQSAPGEPGRLAASPEPSPPATGTEVAGVVALAPAPPHEAGTGTQLVTREAETASSSAGPTSESSPPASASPEPSAAGASASPSAAPSDTTSASPSDTTSAPPTETPTATASPSPSPTTSSSEDGAELLAPDQVAVEVLDRAAVEPAGGVGLGVRLTRTDGVGQAGPVELSLDYSGFRHAYGGDFASRLRLVKMPACALTTPEADGCAAREFVQADNDLAAGKLTATVEADPDASTATDGGVATQLGAAAPAAASTSDGTVYAATTGSSSDTGDYRASPLGQSGSWDVSVGSGAFTYQVPIQVPEPPMGSAPGVALSYNSQSVDGRTSSSNNQASWAGMGWDLNTGFIERRYRNCTQDGLPTIADLCWDSPNTGEEPSGAVYVINLGGVTSPLVQDNTGTGSYHVQDDPGWRVQRMFGGHGADDEYWVVSHQDGTRYYFGWGRSERTGTGTGSVWTVPVVGNDAGEPCHGQFPEPCTQAWRWNVDRVVDGNEVETIYFYDKEYNHYRSVANEDQARRYVSGGYVDEIQYGWSSQIGSGQLPAKVEFSHVNRCAERMSEDNPLDNPPPACPTIASSPSSYPDVPLDLRCDGTADDYHCAGKTYYPTFFLEDMLWDIKTYVRDDNGSPWSLVMQYQMKYALTNPSGPVDGTLWLDYIQRKAYGSDPDLTLPTLNFNGTNLDNQVGPNELRFRRITGVYTALGSKVSVHYGFANPCYAGDLPSQSNNSQDCYWQKWTPEGGEATTGWFKKFLVKDVTVDPRVGEGSGGDGAPQLTTTYNYYGGAGWRFTGDPLTKDEDETWSDWRGYRNPRVTTGAGDHEHSTYYWRYRGLHGDRTSKTDPSATRTVTLTDSTGTRWTDYAWLAGRTLETSHRDNSSGSPVSKKRVRHEYWVHNTAQYVGLPDARFVREKRTTTRTKISTSTSDQSTWREHVVQHEYDDTSGTSTTFGLPLRIDDWGETGVGDNRCTTYGRAYNTDDLNAAGVQRWTVLPDQVRTYSAGCTNRAASNQNSSTVTLYDGAASVAENNPYDGNPTEIRRHTDAIGYRATKAAYDPAGRITETWDGKGRSTTTTYTPANTWPLSGVAVVGPDPDGFGSGTPMTRTTWYSRYWGAPWKIVDANGNTTRIHLDAAGRTAEVWKPTEEPAHPDGDPSLLFGYSTPTSSSNVPYAANGPSRVTSQTLQSGSTYLESHAYFDGLGRVRETQTPAPGGTGRDVTTTRYDSSGNVTGTSAAFHNTGTAGSGMVLPAVSDLPSYHDVVRDWAGRTTEAKIMVNGTDQSAGHTLTEYHGDHTRVTPPVGGATDTYTDVYGQTSRIVEHDGGDTHTTRYGYTGKGELKTITDALGNTTAYTYNWLGDRLTTDDPDAGSSSATYDANGNVATTTDAENVTVTRTYDAMDRLTGIEQGATLLASYTYDTAPGGKGLPATSTSYADGNAWTSTVTGYDARGRALGQELTVPAGAGVLAGTYTVGLHYDAADHVTAVDYPALGGLPAETVTTEYTDQGQVSTLSSPLATYVAATDYDNLARLTGRTYGTESTTGTTAARAYTYDDTNGTGALRTVQTATSASAGLVQDDTFTRNDAGITTAVTDAVAGQRECFRYDPLNRLTAAWTTGSAQQCATTGEPNADFTAGPDPYQKVYTHDPIGNLQSVTDTTASGSTARDYRYPGYSADESSYTPGAAHPHAVTTAGADNYSYNAAGQVTSRTAGGVTSTFEWNAQNRITGITEQYSGGEEETTYVYDAGGALLMRTSATEDVLYVSGHEVHVPAGGTARATRSYVSGGTTVALRTASDTEPDGELTWLMSDGQASTQLTVLAATGAVTRRRYTPYGDQRGGTTLPAGTDRGFLGEPEDDATGLSLLGARMYDPALGRFLSTDELVSPYDPQNLGAYAYARNNPVLYSDPSGLRLACGGAGGTVVPCGEGTMTRGDGSVGTSTSQTGGGSLSVTGYKKVSGGGLRKTEGTVGTRYDRYGNVVSVSFHVQHFRRTPDVQVGMSKWQPYTPGDSTGAHAFLDVLGMTPVIGAGADLLNAGMYITEGNYAEAGMSFVALIPGVGDGIQGARKGIKFSAWLRKTCRNSFVPGTEVLLADGTTKPIEELELGDEVVATDPETGETADKTVTATIHTKDDKRYVDLTVADGEGGSDVLTTTEHHPFWSESEQEWLDAGELDPGMTLRTDDDTTVAVRVVRTYTALFDTYNLTVQDLHTYYVLAGETPVLVHNRGGCVNWASNSVKTWGHTFKTHGAGAKNTKALTDRARSTGNQQGQWLDNDAAAEFLRDLHVEGAGPRSVRIPEGLGQVIMPDGSIVQARAATIVPSPNGLYKTSFPIIGPN
ncbi:polymorphic toxin-type HINT domain-containing protein [Streptomyces sp. JJ36]|uniref:polymorphic toxin-type HINT domain-containing protein n=1 Tax=Streptomyces sp. JJ36 TaxID=2736645 RepID=UPI001F3B2D89|nr:polymorphic toxin-type HINT domain-containing protein [Streptomyces sp. JJ36]MCF6524832.1 hypothetical protein [Streptomyces sp. JJ36]